MNIIYGIFTYIYAFVLAILPLNSYTEGITGQPYSYLPSKAVTLEDKTISKLLYRGLFKYDIYGTLIPDLAETWTISDDGTIYTIKLKDRQYWSNGRKINSDDLIYTAFKVEDLSGVGTDKIDDLTVRYILPNKYSPFISLLTIGVMPSNAEEKMNPLKPITSGDFRVGLLERNGSNIKRVTLVTNNHDYDIKKLIFRYYPNEDDLIMASKLGEIDAFMSQNEYKLDTFQNYKFPLQGIYYALFFNLRDEKYQNLELRQKLEKALPVNQIISDRGITVEGPISRSTFTNKNISFSHYAELYRDNLKESSITITIPDTSAHAELARRIKDIWENSLKLDVKIRKVSITDMITHVIEPRNFEVLLYGQEVGRDPDRYVNWHSSQKEYPGFNLTGLDNVRVDRDLEEGRNETLNEVRLEHYKDFQKMIVDQTPAIFLYHPYTNYYVTKYISGIGQKYTFTTADRFLDFLNWKRIKTN